MLSDDDLRRPLDTVCLALPPRAATGLVVATAEAVDRKIETLPDICSPRMRGRGARGPL
jgi:hypothetical protein